MANFRQYTYNGVTVQATGRRSSSRDDKKYERTVRYDGKERLVHYGDPNMEMQRDNPERREAFLTRHSCDTKKDPFAPGFWACLDWQRTDEGKSMADTTVTIKSVTEDTITVAGYGVVFGGTDLDGETFDSDTDYMLDLVPQKLVLYDHGQNSEVKHAIIGKISADGITVDDDGIWIEAELSKHAAYVEHIRKLAEKGVLGWSSGSVGHLVSRAGKSIKRWPIIEFSLTPTPAEPRTLGVEVIKSLGETVAALQGLSDIPEVDTGETPVDISESSEVETKAATSEDARPASARTAVEAGSDSQDTDIAGSNEDAEGIMSEDVKVAEATETKKADAGNGEIMDMLKKLSADVELLKDTPANPIPVQQPEPKAPVTIKSLGDSEAKSIAAWYRTGDMGAVKHLQSGDNQITIKASNDTDMNIGTSADGGYAVPTGHYQGIIARMRELALYTRLGVMMIPGKGTTVNVPIDNEADGEFVSTAETTAFDRDTPALGQKQFTLVKYTKTLPLSYELLEDEDSRLMSFVESWVGQGLGRTHNSLMITEALANGTAGLTLDAAAAIGAAEVPELMYKLKGEYADGAAWVMDRTTEGYIRGLTGNNFQFVPTPQGSNAGSQVNTVGRDLFGVSVYNTAYMPDIGAGLKSLLIGNFSFMGLYMAPDLTFLRDPYSLAVNGQVRLHYYTRVDYGVLQAEAFQYATHPTA
jgi:HK97 family phage major capsid protein